MSIRNIKCKLGFHIPGEKMYATVTHDLHLCPNCNKLIIIPLRPDVVDQRVTEYVAHLDQIDKGLF